MCGIAGYWNTSGNVDSGIDISNYVLNMCNSIAHRGPDAHDIYTETAQKIALGHRRLSVIDIQNGKQPMADESQRIWLVFNGEIYNYRELKKELSLKGYSFRTESDTEVVLNAYKEWGVNCVKYFQGMFAFSIWDSVQKALFCARDRLGIKPFYYLMDDGCFIFCSELKGILANRKIYESDISYSALSSYLNSSYSPGGETIVKGIKKLKPGHILWIKDGQCRTEEYWQLQNQTSDMNIQTFDEASSDCRARLFEAVESNLVSDVPIGAFLSGGVDSSSVVGIMSHLLKRPVETYCVGFSSARHDERQFAAEVSGLFATSHHSMVVGGDVGKKLDTIVQHMDEPFADSSAIPMYYLSQLARQNTTVCLSGDGGDEIFAGYSWYRELLKLQRIDSLIPFKVRDLFFRRLARLLPVHLRGTTFLNNMLLPADSRHSNLVKCFRHDLLEKVVVDDLRDQLIHKNPLTEHYQNSCKDWDDIKRAQFADLKTYLVEDILMKVDRMSMAHSLEVRVPLLDHRLVEYVFNQPTDYKIQGKYQKKLLKRAVSDLIPERLLNRNKQGFSVPIRQWLLSDLKERVGDLLLTSNVSNSGTFKTQEVQKLWKKLHSDSGNTIDLSQHIWTLLCYEMWHQQYVA